MDLIKFIEEQISTHEEFNRAKPAAIILIILLYKGIITKEEYEELVKFKPY